MNSLDYLKHTREQILKGGSYVGELKLRAKQNPHLNEIVDEYYKLQNTAKYELEDALQLIKSHIESLRKLHGNDSDMLEKLNHDYKIVQNKLNHVSKQTISMK